MQTGLSLRNNKSLVMCHDISQNDTVIECP